MSTLSRQYDSEWEARLLSMATIESSTERLTRDRFNFNIDQQCRWFCALHREAKNWRSISSISKGNNAIFAHSVNNNLKVSLTVRNVVLPFNNDERIGIQFLWMPQADCGQETALCT